MSRVTSNALFLIVLVWNGQYTRTGNDLDLVSCAVSGAMVHVGVDKEPRRCPASHPGPSRLTASCCFLTRTHTCTLVSPPSTDEGVDQSLIFPSKPKHEIRKNVQISCWREEKWWTTEVRASKVKAVRCVSDRRRCAATCDQDYLCTDLGSVCVVTVHVWKLHSLRPVSAACVQCIPLCICVCVCCTSRSAACV